MGTNQGRPAKRGRTGKTKSWKFWALIVAVPVIVAIGSSMAVYTVYVKKKGPEKQGVEQGLLYAKLNRHTEAIKEFKKELAKNPDNANVHYYMGISYMKLKEYDQANYEFKAAIRIKPTFFNASLQLAVVSMTQAVGSRKIGGREPLVLEKLLEAEEICRGIIAENPDFIDAYALLGEIHFSQGLFDDAIIDYKHALNIDDSFLGGHIALARLYMNSGKFDNAEKQCSDALSKLDPDNLQIQMLLSTIYERQGKYEEAVESLKRIIKKTPENVVARTQLGLLYLKTSKYDEAFSEAQKVDEVSSGRSMPPAIYFIKGSVLLQRKDYRNAISLLKEASLRLPKMVESHYFLALALTEGGRVEEAKSEFKAAIDLAPGFIPAKIGLARLLTKDGWQEETVRLCEEILGIQPDNVDAMQLLGLAYMREEDFENAEVQFNKIAQLRPSIGDVNMAYLSLSSGQLSKCILQCEAIIAANPEEAKAYDILGLAHIRRGSFDKGVEHFKKAIEIDPSAIAMHLNLAKAYIITGKSEEAVSTLEKAISLNPDNLDARVILADLYEKRGEIDEAIKLLERVLEMNPDYLPGYALVGLYLLQGDTDKSIDLYRKAIRLDSTNTLLQISIALSYQQKEKYSVAIPYCQKAIDLKQDVPSYKIILSNIYAANENFDEAKKLIESITTLSSDQKHAYLELLDLCFYDKKKSKKIAFLLNKAIYARLKGSFDIAISECKKAVNIFPENIVAKVILANTYLSAKQNEEAIKIYSEIIKDKPEFVSSYYDLGKAYIMADKQDEAISIYKNVLDVDSKSVPARLAIAELLLRKGSIEEATKMVGEVIELDPENIMAHNLLGKVNLAGTEYEKAETEFSKMIELKSDTFEGHFNMARIKFAQGEYDECIEHCNIALQTKTADVRVHNILGMAFLKKGKLSNAVAVFNKILSINSDFVPAYLNLANINMTARKPGIALLLYKAALKVNPDAVEARFGLGGSLASMGKHTEAIREFETIIKSYPDNINTFNSMARSYMALNELDKAQESVMNALSIKPESPIARSLLAMIYVKKESIPEAIKQLNRVLEGNPKFAGAYELGILYLDRGDNDNSLLVCKQGLEHFPENILLWCNMAVAYLLKEDYKSAKETCRKTLNLQPDGIMPNLCLVNTLLAEGKYDSAKRHIKGMVKLGEGQKTDYQELIGFCAQNKDIAVNVSQYLSRAIAFTESRWFKRALREYEAITKVVPSGKFAYSAQIDILTLTRQDDKAIEICKKVIKLQPEFPDVYIKLAGIYNRSGQNDDAVAQYRKVISIDPENVIAHLNLGMLLESKDLLDESIESYKKVIELDGSSVAACNNLAWLYASRMQGKLEDALKLAEKAKGFAPNSPAVADTLGWVYYLNGLYDKAAAELETAVSGATWNPTIRYHLGMVYYKQGLQRKALAEMERALNVDSTFPEADEAREIIEKIIVNRIKGA
jgi:Predicted N-acetylglucosaminyl transferase